MSIASSLTALTKNGSGPQRWDEKYEEAFKTLEIEINETSVLPQAGTDRSEDISVHPRLILGEH